MAAANYDKLNFLNQRNEPHHEKEHVKISNVAKFQSCRPNTYEMLDIWKPRKYETNICSRSVYPCLTANCLELVFSGFSNVYYSACVWPTVLKLGCVTNFSTLFLVMGFISLIDEIQFMLISSRHICVRSIYIFLLCLWFLFLFLLRLLFFLLFLFFLWNFAWL